MSRIKKIIILLVLASTIYFSAMASPADKVGSNKYGVVGIPQSQIKEIVAALKKDKRSGLFNIKGYSVYAGDEDNCAYYIPSHRGKTWLIGNRCPLQTRFLLSWDDHAQTISPCLHHYPDLYDTDISYETTFPLRADRIRC